MGVFTFNVDCCSTFALVTHLGELNCVFPVSVLHCFGACIGDVAVGSPPTTKTVTLCFGPRRGTSGVFQGLTEQRFKCWNTGGNDTNIELDANSNGVNAPYIKYQV